MKYFPKFTKKIPYSKSNTPAIFNSLMLRLPCSFISPFSFAGNYLVRPAQFTADYLIRAFTLSNFRFILSSLIFLQRTCGLIHTSAKEP